MPNHTVVFNTAAEQGLLSKHAITDVVFLIRHPLHAYVSWAKPERHGAVIHALGGLNSRRGVEHYGRRWLAFATECLTLQKMGILGGIIRYEFARKDAQRLDDLEWIFADFASDRRNFGHLRQEYEELLRGIVLETYSALYPEWNV
jgi:hypothetical protein